MDLSAVIFVSLAVAWAVYLIPKALKHHDEVVRSRSVDRFSHTMRVLARREPVNRRDARLVVTPARAVSVPVVTTKGPAPSPVQLRARREAGNRAARRRRRVLGTVLLANAAVVGVAAFGLVNWLYVAIPVTLLVAWLVTCRVMVTSERRANVPAATVTVAVSPAPVDVPDEFEVARNDQGFDEVAPSAETATLSASDVRVDPALWDPVPITLPTYVTKPVATRRTVRTIDLESTGVWTSGRTDVDAQIVRDAEAAAKAARAEATPQRAVGS